MTKSRIDRFFIRAAVLLWATFLVGFLRDIVKGLWL